MPFSKDSSGNSYIDFGEWTRITFVTQDRRARESNWAGSPVLRIQSYRDKQSSSLHVGAEIPLRDVGDLIDFLGAVLSICRLYLVGETSEEVSGG